jgi:23S rRNA pseudouridine2605 synthase
LTPINVGPFSATALWDGMSSDQNKTPPGDRIAKVLARAGVASRREAERMIEAGRVAVNGVVIDSPALNVSTSDRITVDEAPIAEAQPARLWLYYKPIGLVTTERDEKGRETVFEALPKELPRVMSVGRLDINSEGLLLLTNDGELKRKLELPTTGWLRKYRVRVNGRPNDDTLAPLRKGITVDGENFQPMSVAIDRQQGANAWLTVGIREGRNREVRRAMDAVGLSVNRLLRISYGPFRLGDLKPGDVEEIKARVLRDQLGYSDTDSAAAAEKPQPQRTRKPGAGPRRRERDDFGNVKSAPRPEGKSFGKPGGKPAGRPGATDKPAGRAFGKPGGKPGDKPEGRGARSGGKPGGAPAGRFGKPGGNQDGGRSDSRGPDRGGPRGGRPGGKPGGGQGGRPQGKPGGNRGPRQR